MSFEGLLFGLLLAAACVPAVCAMRRRWMGLSVLVLFCLVLAAPAATRWTGWKSDEVRRRTAIDLRPIEVEQDGYVSSDTCKACHPGEYSSWHASFHRTMTQFATVDSVLAPFDGEQLKDDDGLHVLKRRGDEFWAEMPDPLWRGDPAQRPRVERRIVMLTGSHHYQVYWLHSGNSRIVLVLPFIWLIDEARWITRGAAFLGPEERTKHILGVWNDSCIKCHSTRGMPTPNGEGGLDTRVAEIGIACEACHGPAAEHVARHRDPRERFTRRGSDVADPSITNPASLARDTSSQVCGQCHGVWRHDGVQDWREWMLHGLQYRPGEDLHQSVTVVRHSDQDFLAKNPSYRLERQFWSDGMVRVSGREYNGLIETACYSEGEMSCLSCHRLHRDAADPRTAEVWRVDQLDQGMQDDEACLQCHPSYRDDLPSHTHHEAGSSGSRCYNCHMPYTTYGLMKAIRSHQVDSPSVADSLSTGRPNACNQCHLDQTLGWTAERLESWYGISSPPLPPQHDEVAAAVLWSLTGDAGQRALMAWSFGWSEARTASGSDWMAPYLAQLLDDPYQAVRLIAHRSLRDLPGYEAFEYDFLGPAEERAAARLRALEIWRNAGGRSRAGEKPAVSLRDELFDALSARRNDRVVELHE